MLKKLLFLFGVVGAGRVRREEGQGANDERALWHEATTAPDLR